MKTATQPLHGERSKKPVSLKAILILNGLMTVLPFAFYFVITSKGIELGGLQPVWMIYAAIAYMVSFAALNIFISKKMIWGIRAVFALNVLIALPVAAYIGILFAIISISLSFLSKKLKVYFND